MASITDILPLEIIQHIIDIVSWNDHRTHHFKSGPDVKACSLTCRLFCPRSQQHIFHSIKLYDIDRSGQYPGHGRSPLASKFAELVTHKPDVGTYVRELHYVLQNMRFGNCDTYPVPLALKGLTNLETVALYPESGEFRWKDIHSSSRSLLLRLMYLPTIVSVKLKLIRGFTPSDLIPCTNLKNLHLQSVTLVETIDFSSSISIPTPIKLRELELGFCSALTVVDIMDEGLINGRPILNLGRIKKITVNNISLKDVSSTAKVLRYTNSLEAIHWTVIRFLDDVGPVFSALSDSLDTLRSLNLDVYIDRPYHDLDPLCGVPQALRRIAGINHIESLTIRIQLSRDTKFGAGDEWGALEEVLLGPGWPSLIQFDLSIFSEGIRKDQWLEKAQMLPHTKLSVLSSSAFLKFNFFAAEGCRIPPSSIDKSMQLLF